MEKYDQMTQNTCPKFVANKIKVLIIQGAKGAVNTSGFVGRRFLYFSPIHPTEPNLVLLESPSRK